ncbi:hypothetical protein PO124_03000 [Bacillus licheniformis]|nr:hypothetical protein [Bacillus licheniformis]
MIRTEDAAIGYRKRSLPTASTWRFQEGNGFPSSAGTAAERVRFKSLIRLEAVKKGAFIWRAGS